MLSAIIALATLFIHRTSSCASILINGIPSQPLHVCTGYRSSSVTFYFQLVCDETGSGVYMSGHMSATCSDTEFAEIPYTLEGGVTLNCEQVYDCSYAKYRLYNDTTNSCAHTTLTPYFELPMVIDECAYDTSVGGSTIYSCDDFGIYSNVQIGDTDAVCDDTQEIPYIAEGCSESTGQYVEISKCVYNEKTTPDSDTAGTDTFLTQNMIIIIAVIGGVLLLTIMAGAWCYKKRANKETNAKQFTHVPQTSVHNNQSSEGGRVVSHQQIQIQTRPNNVRNVHHMQHNSTDIPPPPPPGYNNKYNNNSENMAVLNPKRARISQWFTQNVQISATDANNYVQIFMDNGFDDLSAFYGITTEDLVEIGINKLGHRKLIMKAIQSIQ